MIIRFIQRYREDKIDKKYKIISYETEAYLQQVINTYATAHCSIQFVRTRTH